MSGKMRTSTMSSQNYDSTVPQPEEISQREREDAMGAYLMTFGAASGGFPAPMLAFIVALVYHAINAKKSAFVAFHSFQALIVELPVSICNAVLVIWMVVMFWDVLMPGNNFHWPKEMKTFLVFLACCLLVNFIYLIFSIIACIRAYNGRFFYFIFFGRIAFLRYYGPGRVTLNDNDQIKRNIAPRRL